MKNYCEQLEIDTKDICLLCLGSKIETNGFTSSSSLPSSQGLKHLLRYLKVSPKELFNCSSEFLQSMEIREDIDLKISLCSKCSSVTEKFNKLYQDYQLIQLEFGNCVQSLHESISKGNESPERVRKYKDQMRPVISADLVNASIAANLRNETLKKCSLKLQSGMPRVRVTPQNLLTENCTKLPKPVSFPTSFVSNNTILLDPETTSRRGSQFIKNSINSQFRNNDASAENSKPTNVPTNRNLNRKKGYFGSLRKKLKTKSQPTAATATSISTFTSNNRKRPICTKAKNCDYCKMKFTRHHSLRVHKLTVHSEHYIIKFLPSHVSLELCRQRIHVVWDGMIKHSNYECQFCKIRLNNTGNLKRHLMSCHAEQFAKKVSDNIESFPNLHVETKFSCEYCDYVYLSRLSLKHHQLCVHADHLVYKFFPRHISLKSCRKGVDDVLEQMFSEATDSGYTCKFCEKISGRKDAFQIHVVNLHAKEIAAEAQQSIDMSSNKSKQKKRSTIVSSDVVACSSGTRKSENGGIDTPSEDIDKSALASTTTEMDFEEESLIKVENPPSQILELDPLDVDYLD